MRQCCSFAGQVCLGLIGSVLLLGNGCGGSESDTVVADSPMPSSVRLALQAYVKASNTQAASNNTNDAFGDRIAVSGDTLAVSAPSEDSCATGLNGDQTNNACEFAGAVYVFTRTSGVWSQQAYIKASNAEAMDFFGQSLALSGDTLAVGAPSEDSCATGLNGDQTNNDCVLAGAVYVFTRTNGVWSQQAYLKASNPQGSESFGQSLALSGDTLAVGAPNEDSCARGINGDQTNNGCGDAGAAYVFTRINGVWSQQAYVKASDSEGFDCFGWNIALSGDTLAVTNVGEAICGTGLPPGSTIELKAGAAYVFVRVNGTWSQQAHLRASNFDFRDSFGVSVGLNGNTLAVGAPNEGSCATGVNGDQASNSCGSAGAGYVFTRTNGVWTQQAYLKASNAEAGDRFGWSLALNGDRLAVGAVGEASCATGSNGDQSNNGCHGAGAAYVFTRSSGTWTQQAYLKASNATGGFGDGIALSGNMLAVGASFEASCATGINGDQTSKGCQGAGAVYVHTVQ